MQNDPYIGEQQKPEEGSSERKDILDTYTATFSPWQSLPLWFLCECF